MLWRKTHTITSQMDKNTRKHACENDNHVFNLLFCTMLHKLDVATIAEVMSVPSIKCERVGRNYRVCTKHRFLYEVIGY